jgi:hypothetical protein
MRAQASTKASKTGKSSSVFEIPIVIVFFEIMFIYVDKPTRYVVRGARVGKHRLARGLARHVQSNREN